MYIVFDGWVKVSTASGGGGGGCVFGMGVAMVIMFIQKWSLGWV